VTAAFNIASHQTAARPGPCESPIGHGQQKGDLAHRREPGVSRKVVLRYKEAILKAVRAVDRGVCDIQENGVWRRCKLVSIPWASTPRREA